MSTIIRVKRHHTDEPEDAIVLNCKRRKINETSGNESEATAENALLLQFAGTVTNQDDALSHSKTSLKDAAESHFKTQPKVLETIRERFRNEFFANSKENRYKVVNLCRSNTQEDTELTIVDVEAKPKVENEEKSSEYVYDLYYTTSDDLGEIYEQDLVGVYPVNNELVFGSHRDNGFNDSDDDSSEDSNAENNWRNDYPDEDEFHDENSITEDDMLGAMQRVKLDDSDRDDLSTDEEVEGFIYSIDSEAAGFEEDIDDTDVNRYGERYARFRAKYKRSERDSSVDDEDFYHDYNDAENSDNEASGSYY